MKKTCHRFHPPEYDPGATEVFYENMARKGWVLKERGTRLSAFRREEPQELRYRVEYVADKAAEPRDMPQEQLALYLDCGWTLAAYERCFYIFSTKADNPAQELYSDPEEQAETVRSFDKMSNWSVFYLLVLGVPIIIWRILRLKSVNATEAEWRTASLSLIGLFLFYASLYTPQLFSILGWKRLYRRLAAGEPVRRGGKRWYLLWRWLCLILFAVSIFLIYYGLYRLSLL